MKVGLVGGPLAGTVVAWPADGREARFPTAEVVQAYGIRYGADTEHGRIVIDWATYRLLPHVGNLWARVLLARHVD